MCVHLVKKTDSGATVSVYEDPTRKSAQAYFSEELPAYKPVRSVSFTEVLRRKENDRLTGKAFDASCVEEHRLSAQSSFEMKPFFFDSHGGASSHDWKSHKENRGNARDKNRRDRCKASGQRPYIN